MRFCHNCKNVERSMNTGEASNICSFGKKRVPINKYGKCMFHEYMQTSKEPKAKDIIPSYKTPTMRVLEDETAQLVIVVMIAGIICLVSVLLANNIVFK